MPLQNWNSGAATVDHLCPVDGHLDSGIAVPGGLLTSLLDGTAPDQSTFGIRCTQDATVEWFDTNVSGVDASAGDFRAGQALIIRAIMGVLGWSEDNASHMT